LFFESTWSRKSIGDVDVVYHDGLYHLFHLVLPNHDFIAHAISDDALNWRRVDNAIFIGHPGSWDDLMLWTMHVSPDPHQPGRWRMFYTGVSRRDQGRKQRIGLAFSDDLYHWEKADVNWEDPRGDKDPERVKQVRAKLSISASNSISARLSEDSSFPLEPDPRYYEASPDNKRNLVSFRDPYYFREGENGLLLISARVNSGPWVRRGCVAQMKETTPNHFSTLPPLHSPTIYDDVEVPNLFQIEGEYYLVGSIREDVKIRYWHTEELGAAWRAYYDNVLLPRGNYAGRVSQGRDGMLLWHFYTQDLGNRDANNLMPPPKRLRRLENGQLQVSSFEGIAEQATTELNTHCLQPLKHAREDAFCRKDDGRVQIVSKAGFQAFVFEEPVESYHLKCRLSMTGIGKCGILCRVDPETHDGYYISLDLMKGHAQFRSWGTGEPGSGEHMMEYEFLQEGSWRATSQDNLVVEVLSFGSYHELSINGAVILSLANARYGAGRLGFYVETAELEIADMTVHRLDPPKQSDEHLASG